MKNINKRLINHADIEIDKVDGKIYFKFSMSEVKYNKLMNSKVKATKKTKEPTTRELILRLIDDVDSIKNTPTMKKELGLK